MAGTQECNICGALISQYDNKHAGWHQKLRRNMRELEDVAEKVDRNVRVAKDI